MAENAREAGMVSPRWVTPDPAAVDVLNGTQRKIGIIRLWPNQAAAEHESIERYRFACNQIGVTLVEVDRLGFILNGPRRKITKNDVDFVISLHFETPKSYDCFSWGALWNPIDFYLDWGYSTFIDHQFSHDAFFTCGSRVLERVCQTELAHAWSTTPKANVNHTLSGPIYAASQRDDRKLVYCGINWEKLASKGGRFDNLLRPLDQARVLDIFGPQKVQDTYVWEGFEGYKGEVPFDGHSLVGEISRSGAVLALSSNAHLRAGIMTSRLFEGAAAGALVFADENSFVQRYFSDVVVPIKVTGESDRDAREIAAKLHYYNANPEEGFKIAVGLQKRYVDSYLLQDQLLGVYKAFKAERKKRDLEIATLEGRVGYIVFWLDQSAAYPEELIKGLQAQTHQGAYILLVTPKVRGEGRVPFGYEPGPNRGVWFVDDAYGPGKNTFGMYLCDAIDQLPDDVDHVSIATGMETVFSDHSAVLLAAGALNPIGAASAVLTVHYDERRRLLQGEEYVDFWRPRRGQEGLPTTLLNLMFKRGALAEILGGLQLLNFESVRHLLYGRLDEMAAISRPYVSTDLKLYENDTRLSEQPYIPEKVSVVFNRYSYKRKSNEGSQLQVNISGNVGYQSIISMTESEKAGALVALLKALPFPKPIVKFTGKVLRFLFGMGKKKK